MADGSLRLRLVGPTPPAAKQSPCRLSQLQAGCSRLQLPDALDAKIRNAVIRLTIDDAGQQTFNPRAQLAEKPSAEAMG